MATDYKNKSLWQLNSNISVLHLLVLQLSSLPTYCFGIFHPSISTYTTVATDKKAEKSLISCYGIWYNIFHPFLLTKKVAHLLLWPLITIVVNLFSSPPSYSNGTLKCLSHLFYSLCLFTAMVTDEARFYLSISFSSTGTTFVKNLSPLSIASYKRSLLAYTAMTTDKNFLPLSMASDKKISPAHLFWFTMI